MVRGCPAVFVAWIAAFSGVVLSMVTAAAVVDDPAIIPDFVSVHVLRDGERERWVHRGGITARETSVVAGGGLRLWQVTEGIHLLQSIYDGQMMLHDCEDVKDRALVEQFLTGVEGDVARARVLMDDHLDREIAREPDANVTVRLLHATTEDPLVSDELLSKMLDYQSLRTECKELHKKIRKYAKHRGGKHRNDIERLKREIFIYPGTNWCGIGSASDRYNELGFNAAADRCCRQHDYCAYTIEGFTTKYNLFNYRFHTLSHCECDERFRTCLKMVNSAASNIVGKLFFNVVQMRCFILKSERVCVRRSWWGKCIKYEMQKTAHLKDALTF